MIQGSLQRSWPFYLVMSVLAEVTSTTDPSSQMGCGCGHSDTGIEFQENFHYFLIIPLAC